MTPGPIERLKPYFKPRPKNRPAAAAPAQPQAVPATAQAVPPAPVAQQPVPAAPQAPESPELTARREQLAARFAELQSDLGGLVYEMAIRDSFKTDVVVRRAAELQGVDIELTAVERQLGLAPAATCPSCGTAVQPGAQYCARCGTLVNGQAPGPGVGA